MIRLRCTGTPPQELELAGSGSDLAEVREAVRRCLRLKRPLLEIPVDQETDPAPYERRLVGLRFVRSKELLRFDVDGDRLVISGKPELLTTFVEAFPVEPGQVAFDPFDRADQVQADSPGILLSTTD